MSKKNQIGMVFLCTVIVSIISPFILRAIQYFIGDSFVIMVANQLLLLSPSAVYIATNRVGIKKSIRIKKVTVSNVFLCIILAFLIMPIMNLINALSLLVSENVIQQTITDVVGNSALFSSVFAIAIIPALFEETIFRGVLYNEYRKKNVGVAILLSAFLFGIMHQNFNQFTYAFAMGIVFALLIEATDSIASTMIIHFVINGSSVLLTYLTPKIMELMKEYGGNAVDYEQLVDTTITREAIVASLGYYFVSATIATILAFLVFRTIANNTGRWNHVKAIFTKDKENLIVENDETENIDRTGGIFSVPLVIGIVVSLLILIANEIYIAVYGL